ncbi:MAG: cation transporter [Chloroflexota bacterium]
MQRGLRLEYVTLSWNIVGTIVVILAAVTARSVALAGFALDSVIEMFASVVVVWQLQGSGKNREQRALRLIGAAFFALALYIIVQSANTLFSQTHPDRSLVGMVWLMATLIAMLLLAWGKHQTGEQLSNPVLLTEGRVTLVDAYLAGAVLIGLLLNTVFGWWWADPVAALVVVYYGIREGWHAWHEGIW